MDRCCAPAIARRSETTHSGVDVNNTHLSMINPLNINLAMTNTRPEANIDWSTRMNNPGLMKAFAIVCFVFLQIAKITCIQLHATITTLWKWMI